MTIEEELARIAPKVKLQIAIERLLQTLIVYMEDAIIQVDEPVC
jgi:hypothetical protein